jgi:membrane protease subunit HflK
MAHTFNVRRSNSPHPINPVVIWRIIRWTVIAVLIAYGVMTSIYTIETNSAGVVKRFGNYNRITEPGIHLKLPYGIE